MRITKFNRHSRRRDAFMLHGPLARLGYDWWWHSFTAIDDETGDVLSTEEDLCHAEWACNRYGVSKAEIDELGLKYLRKGIKGPKIGNNAC